MDLHGMPKDARVRLSADGFAAQLRAALHSGKIEDTLQAPAPDNQRLSSASLGSDDLDDDSRVQSINNPDMVMAIPAHLRRALSPGLDDGDEADGSAAATPSSSSRHINPEKRVPSALALLPKGRRLPRTSQGSLKQRLSRHFSEENMADIQAQLDPEAYNPPMDEDSSDNGVDDAPNSGPNQSVGQQNDQPHATLASSSNAADQGIDENDNAEEDNVPQIDDTKEQQEQQEQMQDTDAVDDNDAAEVLPEESREDDDVDMIVAETDQHPDNVTTTDDTPHNEDVLHKDVTYPARDEPLDDSMAEDASTIPDDIEMDARSAALADADAKSSLDTEEEAPAVATLENTAAAGGDSVGVVQDDEREPETPIEEPDVEAEESSIFDWFCVSGGRSCTKSVSNN
jgi:hypothetical protein